MMGEQRTGTQQLPVFVIALTVLACLWGFTLPAVAVRAFVEGEVIAYTFPIVLAAISLLVASVIGAFFTPKDFHPATKRVSEWVFGSMVTGCVCAFIVSIATIG